MKKLITDSLPLGNNLCQRLISLNELYDELDGRLASFAAAGFYRCPPGCGACCAKFEPDILPVEALFAAVYILKNNLLPPEDSFAGTGRCPLFLETPDRHCPIYPARPLVCRLFGFSALPDKFGASVYTPCEFMASAFSGSERVSALPLSPAEQPVLMTDFSTRLLAITPHEASNRSILRNSVTDAIGKIGLLEKMTGEQGN